MFSTERKDSGFPYSCTNAAAVDGRQGSNGYKVLWQVGSSKLRMKGLTVEQSTERKHAVSDAAWHKCAAETKRHRKTATA
jgi:hypothetical protein